MGTKKGREEKGRKEKEQDDKKIWCDERNHLSFSPFFLQFLTHLFTSVSPLLQEVCNSVTCVSPHRISTYLAGPALEGTYCGGEKVGGGSGRGGWRAGGGKWVTVTAGRRTCGRWR